MAGDQIRYRITIANTGDTTIIDLTVTDTVAPAVTQQATAQDNTQFSVAATHVPGSGTRWVWSNLVAGGLDLEPGQTFTFTVTGLIGGACANTAVSNTAFVVARDTDGAELTANSNAVDLVVQPCTVGISVVKSQLLPAVFAVIRGTSIQYQLVVTNTGTATLTGLVIVDTLRPEIESVTTTAPGLTTQLPFNVPGGGTRWVWSGTGLAFLPGTSRTVTINGVAGTVGSLRNVSNTAFVAATDGCAVTVATAQSLPATGFEIHPAQVAITVRKLQFPASGGPAMKVGDSIRYMLVVENTGDTTIIDLTVTDTLPPEITAVATAQDDLLFQVIPTDIPGTGTRYVWSNIVAGGLDLGPGKTFTFTITGTIGHVCAPVIWDNRALAEGSGMGMPAPTVLSPAVRFATTPLARTVSVVKTVAPAMPAAGGPMWFDIAVTNTGAETVMNMHMTDLLPPTSRFTATVLVDGGNSATRVFTGIIGTQSQWDWDFGSVPPGQVRTVHIGGNAGDCYTGMVVNTATVTGTTACGTAVLQAGVSSVLLMAPSPNLTVWQDYYPDDPTRTTKAKLPRMGMPIYWKLIVANTGGRPAEDVIIVDSLPSLDLSVDNVQIPTGGVPSGMEWAAVAPLTASGTGGQLVVSLGGTGVSLQPGESVTVWVDTTPYVADVGAKLVECMVHAVGTDPCSGVRLPTPTHVTHITWGCGVTMMIKVFNSAGEIVRSFDPICIGRAPHQMDFSYTAAGTCATYSNNPGGLFTPDGDCSNDILKLVFPELLMVDGQPFDRIWWDGRNDAGVRAGNGLYLVVVESVDPMTGAPVQITKAVLLMVIYASPGDPQPVPIPFPPGSAPNPLMLPSPGAAIDRNVLVPGGVVQVRIAPWNDTPVSIKVFSSSGRLLRTLASLTQIADHQWLAAWDGRDGEGAAVPRGVYIIRIKGGGLDEKLKIVVK